MSKTNKNFYFKKQRVGLVLAGGFATIMMIGMISPTFAGIVASIQNSVNTAITGSLKMKESTKDGAVSCESTDGNASNTATCATINKYGGTANALVPGGSQVSEIKIENTGTVNASSFTVKGGTCASTNVAGAAYSGAGNLCEKMMVKIESGSTVIFNGTAKAFQDQAAIDILAKLSKTSVNKGDAAIPFKITVSLPQDAGDAFQGKQISQPITWQFGA